MNTVRVVHPSFPEAERNSPIAVGEKIVWQVLCGDKNHWRCGIYSPQAISAEQVDRLERHSCLEVFLLIEGRLSLILDEGEGERIVALEPGKPVLVSAWHNGFCQDIPHGGKAFVVERDRFTTWYRERE